MQLTKQHLTKMENHKKTQKQKNNLETFFGPKHYHKSPYSMEIDQKEEKRRS